MGPEGLGKGNEWLALTPQACLAEGLLHAAAAVREDEEAAKHTPDHRKLCLVPLCEVPYGLLPSTCVRNPRSVEHLLLGNWQHLVEFAPEGFPRDLEVLR